MREDHTRQNIVEAVGLTRVFRDFWMRQKARAVDGIDFVIRQHEIFGLLGPNGSGKSTTIKMILGLLNVTSGRLSVFGKPPTDVGVKRRIGYLPEESYMYRFLNARETLDYYGKLFGLDARRRRQRTDELLEMVGLAQVAHRPVGEYSKGMTRRIGLAQALINDPELLILDEPTSGLDPIGTRQVKDLLLELGRRGKTILLSSHLLSDVEDVCDRMVILYGGKIRAQGTAEELLRDTRKTVLCTDRLSPTTVEALEGTLERVEGKRFQSVEAPRQRLEDLFMEIVEQARQEQVATAGAQHGGRTARFLLGDEGEGAGLIDALVREEPAAPVARVQAPKAPATAAPKRDEVLEELLEPEAEKKPAPRTAPPSAAPPAAGRGEGSGGATRPAPAPPPKAPSEVDESVIDSLIDEGDSERGRGGRA
ncbi:MAG: ABC transporter ATP-binding protein [Phycisphaerales bacterium]|nr:ABC transporter ATP-binding protein [Phycisphaerales bacterium]